MRSILSALPLTILLPGGFVVSSIRCPKCNYPLTGKVIAEGRCEICGKRLPEFITKPSPLQAESLDEASSSPPLVPQVVTHLLPRKILAWGAVRAGLGQMMFGTIFQVVGVLILLVVFQFSPGRPVANQLDGVSRPAGPMVELFGFLIFGLGLLGTGTVLTIGGMCMTCVAPCRHHLCAVGAIACLLMAGVLSVLLIVERSSAVGPNISFNPCLSLAVWLLGLGIIVFFLLFLRGVAAFFENTAQAVRAIGYLMMSFLIWLVSTFLVFLLASVAPRHGQGQENISLTIFVLSIGMVMSLWFLILLGSIRNTITRGVREPR